MHFQCTNSLLTLATDDLKKLVLFYTNLLQQEPQPYIHSVYAEFQISGLRLGIFQPKLQAQAEFENIGKGRMSLCFEVQDLDAAIAHLTDIGYPPPEEIILASHGREVYAYDPDGNRLIVHQAVMRSL
ncbi:VOC family protein [Aliterella atlantica]|uniref:Glyoxalase n=1 Tax=Aliterella atlantica CENA595 TaxID=1618023 RepID=A0A0D8ZVA2_9CYAN|nr:VOC family protein [Aliterella atlantica]KJH72394.1 glyoxalase [Aliterella atlantica CENA595]